MDTEEPLTRLVKQEKAYMTNSRVTKEMESAGEESEDGGQYFNPGQLQGLFVCLFICYYPKHI